MGWGYSKFSRVSGVIRLTGENKWAGAEGRGELIVIFLYISEDIVKTRISLPGDTPTI